MAIKKKVTLKQNTNAWMTTYTDLMILLLTFFVLLQSIAIIDKKRKRLALNSLTGAFGFKPGGQAIIGSLKGTNITMGDAPMVQEDIQYEKLRNIALKSSLKTGAKVHKENERIVVTLSNRVLFDYRSSTLRPESKAFLKDVAQALREGNPSLIEFRGYTDPSEVAFEPNPLKRSLYLSTNRAFSVLAYFREACGIPAKDLVAHGFGVNPRKKRSTSRTTELNRQVEIIMDYSEKLPYRLKKPAKKESWLDFKGFLFRFPGDG
jgi:chemotaxis protein MotB